MTNNVLVNFIEIASEKGIKLTKKELKNILENFVCFLKESIENTDEEVVLPKIGRFSFTVKPARQLTHPKTGEKHNISPKKVVKFKISPTTKKAVAENHENRSKK
ncbi:hypothetical protein AB836_00920 [Rickettsiales bacterium (ex Bugula neritina AB1)]|nr:hypothetical protein AB836_00920 [Rickettsiales bacterium (ex Bugula neritina AB1)]